MSQFDFYLISILEPKPFFIYRDCRHLNLIFITKHEINIIYPLNNLKQIQFVRLRLQI